jgi:hypothetical protein
MSSNPNTPKVVPTRNTDKGFIHTVSSDMCPFCEKNNIISGVYLQINGTGHPCCESCYKKEGFEQWYEKSENTLPSTPKQFDWFLQLFYRGHTPDEAMDDM